MRTPVGASAPSLAAMAPNSINTAVNSSPNHGTVYTGGTPTLAYGKKGVTSQAGLKYRKAPRPVYTGGTPTSATGYRGMHKRPAYTMGTPTSAAGYSKRTPAPDRNSLSQDFGVPMGPTAFPRTRGAVNYSPPSSFAGGQYQPPPSDFKLDPGSLKVGPGPTEVVPASPPSGVTRQGPPPGSRTDRSVRRSGGAGTAPSRRIPVIDPTQLSNPNDPMSPPKSWTGKP